jgi:hypothetical protein
MNKKIVACFGLGLDQLPFIKKLSKDFKVIGFDENDKAPGIQYVSKRYNVPFVNKYKILSILKSKNIKKIFSFATEKPLKLIGFLNSKLNLPGAKNSQTSIISNKFLLRKILLKNKVLQPIFFDKSKLPNLSKIKKIIAKPKSGSGSEKIGFVDKNKIKKINHEYFFEKYIENGTMYALDGFYFKNKFLPIALSKKKKYSQNVFIDKILHFNLKNSKIERAASKLIEKHCEILKIEATPIHFEFLFKKNKYYSIDFHIRGPGSGVYSHLMDKLTKPSIYNIQKNLNTITKIKTFNNFFSYVYFFNNSNEILFIKKILKTYNLNSKIILFKKKLNNAIVESTRDRIGAVYIYFNRKMIFLKNIKKLDKLLRNYI